MALSFLRDAVWCKFLWFGGELSLWLVQVMELPERSYLVQVIIYIALVYLVTLFTLSVALPLF